MRAQHGGDLEIVDRALVTLHDGDDAKGVSVLVEEAFGLAEVRRDLWRVIAGENEEFEAGIRGREVLDVHLSRVGGAHERVREQALADDKVRRHGLVGRLNCYRRRILYTDAGREVAIVLEGTILSENRGQLHSAVGRERSQRTR